MTFAKEKGYNREEYLAYLYKVVSEYVEWEDMEASLSAAAIQYPIMNTYKLPEPVYPESLGAYRLMQEFGLMYPGSISEQPYLFMEEIRVTRNAINNYKTKVSASREAQTDLGKK